MPYPLTGRRGELLLMRPLLPPLLRRPLCGSWIQQPLSLVVLMAMWTRTTMGRVLAMQHPVPHCHLDLPVAPHRLLRRLVPLRRRLGRLVSPRCQGRSDWHRDCRLWSAVDRRLRSRQLIPL